MDTIRKTIKSGDMLNLIAEEAAELAQAALKLRRATEATNPTPVSVIEAHDALLEEVADVINALDVWGINLHPSDKSVRHIANEKLQRWANRLEAAEQ